MTRLTAAEVDAEWRRSKDELEQLLGAEVDTLSVPRGYATLSILDAAAACGYRHLFTSEPWLEPREVGTALAYGRLSVTEVTPVSRVAAFARLSRTAVLREASLWYARKAAKAAAGPAYDRVRERLLARR